MLVAACLAALPLAAHAQGLQAKYQTAETALSEKRYEEAARLFDGENASSLLPVLIRLADNSTTDDETTSTYLTRARQLANAAGLSSRLRAILEIISALKISSNDSAYILRPDDSWPSDVRAFLYVEHARILERQKQTDKAEQFYLRVMNSGLDRSHPLMQFAALRLASISIDRKAPEIAAAYLMKSGLKPEQCSLLDASPILKNRGIGYEDYPLEAIRMGFEGHMVTNFDITTTGEPQAPRTVVAFPPFVFNSTVEKGSRRLRFKPIYREGTMVGCSGYEQGYRFSIPGGS